MMETVLKDRRGNALVTLRNYQTCPGLSKLALRIEKEQISNGDSPRKDLNGTIVRLIMDVNRSLKPKQATEDEIIAALESRIVVDCLAHRIKEMRDPAGYFSEAEGA